MSTMQDALALYPWSHSISWCLADVYRNGEQCCFVGPCGSGRTLHYIWSLPSFDKHVTAL